MNNENIIIDAEPTLHSVEEMEKEILGYINCSKKKLTNIFGSKKAVSYDILRTVLKLTRIGNARNIRPEIFLSILLNKKPLGTDLPLMYFVRSEPNNPLIYHVFEGFVSNYLESLKPLDDDVKNLMIDELVKHHGFVTAEETKGRDLTDDEILEMFFRDQKTRQVFPPNHLAVVLPFIRND